MKVYTHLLTYNTAHCLSPPYHRLTSIYFKSRTGSHKPMAGHMWCEIYSE